MNSSKNLYFYSIKENRHGLVYAIQAENTNRYKIGRTKNLKSRLEQLSKQSPYSLKGLLAISTLDTITDEAKIHAALNDFRVRGEWFEIDDIKVLENNFKSFTNEMINKDVFSLFDSIGVNVNSLIWQDFYFSISHFLTDPEFSEETDIYQNWKTLIKTVDWIRKFIIPYYKQTGISDENLSEHLISFVIGYLYSEFKIASY